MVNILDKKDGQNKMNEAYNIENEINNLRNQLKTQNITNVKEMKYEYQEGVYYMDIIAECEKLADYVLNIDQAEIEKKI